MRVVRNGPGPDVPGSGSSGCRTRVSGIGDRSRFLFEGQGVSGHRELPQELLPRELMGQAQSGLRRRKVDFCLRRARETVRSGKTGSIVRMDRFERKVFSERFPNIGRERNEGKTRQHVPVGFRIPDRRVRRLFGAFPSDVRPRRSADESGSLIHRRRKRSARLEQGRGFVL